MDHFLGACPQDEKVKYWSFGDQAISCTPSSSSILPLASFNHISREVISLEKSIIFYRNILGFQEIPRPDLDCHGSWLFGYGVRFQQYIYFPIEIKFYDSIHLIETKCLQKRLDVLQRRKEHFVACLPTVDHIAFITTDVDFVQRRLETENVFYRRFDPKEANISQLFIFDPDGNVIEVSSCGVPVGLTKCVPMAEQVSIHPPPLLSLCCDHIPLPAHSSTHSSYSFPPIFLSLSLFLFRRIIPSPLTHCTIPLPLTPKGSV
jgi:catechol 2,3-dioxygenase-like lactoylglutathione lyase family enzyme